MGLKVVEFALNGKTYKLCFNLHVFAKIFDKFGGLEEMNDAISGTGADMISAWTWLTAALSEGGALWAAENGENCGSLTVAEISANVGAFEFVELRAKAMEALASADDVGIKASPKAEATAGEM